MCSECLDCWYLFLFKAHLDNDHRIFRGCTVTVVTNALFLILLNCIASRLTVEQIASNSCSSRTLNVVMLELTSFFGAGSALLALHPIIRAS